MLDERKSLLDEFQNIDWGVFGLGPLAVLYRV